MEPRPKLKSAVFLLLLCAAGPAAAWYQVEVIVFQYLRPNTDGEQFAEAVELPETGGAIELTAGGAAAGSSSPFSAYRVISSAEYRLGGVYQALRSSQDYRPLLHLAWEQPGAGEGPARVVHLAQSSGPAATGTADPAADRFASIQSAGKIVDGTVRVRSGRFLYVDVDMAYLPESLSAAASPAATAVRLQTTRKIKLNEVHYLDHPLFGVILEVSRLRADLPGTPGGDIQEEGGEEPLAETPDD